MSAAVRKLVLLPGMDGTEELFRNFTDVLPGSFETNTVKYPTDTYFTYSELASFVQAAVPVSEPFVLIAESFSTPLAIQYAATNPPNLKGLVICAGFVTSPVTGWQRFACSLLAPVLFRMTLPEFACRFLLVGPDASSSLITAVQSAVSSVKPGVLSARLRAVFACDARAELSRIKVPVLYMQAEQDRLISSSCLEEIRRLKPHIAVTAIAGPHLLLQREPEKAAAIIAKFICGLE